MDVATLYFLIAWGKSLPQPRLQELPSYNYFQVLAQLIFWSKCGLFRPPAALTPYMKLQFKT
jgi:hypothetical protein